MNEGDPLDQTLGSGDSIPSLFAGRYRILRPLGRGASKDVYLAHDERLDRRVALALLTRGAGSARVRREMQVTGRLGEHPHVVTVHDAGEHDGLTYLVLRAVEGGSLTARVDAAPGGRLPLEEVLRIGREVADALAHAHAHGVVHRDVKPDNVWLDGAGHAVLGDFGVALDGGDAARLTTDRAVKGTLAYLSPEQARGDPASPASDLYGLGATLYELACGRPPFTGDTAEALIAQHLHTAPAPPSAREPAAASLDSLLLRLLAKDPAQRAVSAESARDELAALAAGAAPAPLDRGLVGRASAMSALRAACDKAIAGGVRVVGLAGEAGIGKTRCAEELATYAGGRGCVVAWGACEEDEGAPAYWPWRRVLRELGDVTGELLSAPVAETDPDEARFALWEGIARWLAESAARRPLVIVLEDAHWADPSSLGLLAHLTRALRGVPLLVLLTHRPADERLHEALGRLAGFSGLELDGLDADEVAQLAEAVGGRPVPAAEARSLLERTRGNPASPLAPVAPFRPWGPAGPCGPWAPVAPATVPLKSFGDSDRSFTCLPVMALRAMFLPVMSFAAVAVPDTARNSARNATAIVLDGRRLRMERKTTSVIVDYLMR